MNMKAMNKFRGSFASIAVVLVVLLILIFGWNDWLPQRGDFGFLRKIPHADAVCQLAIEGRVVNIPPYFLDMVESEELTGFGSDGCKKNIKSFGYEVEIGNGFSPNDLIPWRQGSHRRSDHRLTVGVNVDPSYRDSRAIEIKFWNLMKLRGIDGEMLVSGFDFEEGLWEVSLKGSGGVNAGDESFYVGRDNGRIVAYVVCSNRVVRNPPCRHYFAFKGSVGVGISLQYSRSYLDDWKKMQTMINAQFLSFVGS